MEEEERPRKQQKLNIAVGEGQEERAPAMSDAMEEKVDDHTTTATHENNDILGDDHSAANDEDNDSEADANEQQPGSEVSAGTLSKNQLKKIRRQEAWEASRADRKAKKKEKIAAKKERKRNAWEEARKNGVDPEAEGKKAQRNQPSTLVPLTFVLDCGFDELMMDKERISLGSQLTRCYSDNGRSKYRVHYVISSFDKLLKERFDTVLGKTYENWKAVRTMPEDYIHAAEKAEEWMKEPQGGEVAGILADQTDAKPEDGEVVYLSSDSPNTLTELKPYSTYIIGGLVDKNRHKGICYRQATERGIKTAKLPIGEYIQMSSRAVLATNHVMEIMLRWLEVGDWGEAFMQVIPQRKGGQLKKPKGAAAAEEEQEGENEDTPKAEAGQPTEEETPVVEQE